MDASRKREDLGAGCNSQARIRVTLLLPISFNNVWWCCDGNCQTIDRIWEDTTEVREDQTRRSEMVFFTDDDVKCVRKRGFVMEYCMYVLPNEMMFRYPLYRTAQEEQEWSTQSTCIVALLLGKTERNPREQEASKCPKNFLELNILRIMTKSK